MAGKEKRSSYLYWPERKAGKKNLRHIISPVLEERERRRVLHMLKIKRLKFLLKDQAISFHFDNCFSHYIHNVCSFCLSYQLYWGIFSIFAMYPSAYRYWSRTPVLLTGALDHLLGEIWCSARWPEENSSPHLRPLLPIAQILLNTASAQPELQATAASGERAETSPAAALYLTGRDYRGVGARPSAQGPAADLAVSCSSKPSYNLHSSSTQYPFFLSTYLLFCPKQPKSPLSMCSSNRSPWVPPAPSCQIPTQPVWSQCTQPVSQTHF